MKNPATATVAAGCAAAGSEKQASSLVDYRERLLHLR